MDEHGAIEASDEGKTLEFRTRNSILTLPADATTFSGIPAPYEYREDCKCEACVKVRSMKA